MSDKREQINELDQSYWAYVKRQFRKNKRAMFSLYVISFLLLIAIFADVIANEKPLVAKYKGTTTFPVFKSYAVGLGLTQWPPELQNVKWSDLDYDFAIFPPIPYTPQNMDYNNTEIGPFAKQDVKSTRWRHLLGTDELGRDVASGMIHATRIAFSVGIISMSIATLIGILMGSLAGFFGDNRLQMSRIRFILNIIFLFFAFFYAFGARSYAFSDAAEASNISLLWQIIVSLLIFFGIMSIANLIAIPLKKIPALGKRMSVPMDLIISRIIEVFVSVPRLFLIISIVAIIRNPSLAVVMVIIGLTSWMGIARLIRGELLRVRSLEYIEAATALGFSDVRALLKHAIPNALSPVLIAIAFGIAGAVLTEAFLSFIGIGVPAETVTWGSLLNVARSYTRLWWLAVFPGFAIFLTITFFNLIGEGLTDALDPKLKK